MTESEAWDALRVAVDGLQSRWGGGLAALLVCLACVCECRSDMYWVYYTDLAVHAGLSFGKSHDMLLFNVASFLFCYEHTLATPKWTCNYMGCFAAFCLRR